MKKFLMVWLPLLLILAGGVGVGVYFLRESPSDDVQIVEENSPEYKEETIAVVYKKLPSISHIEQFETQLPALTQLETATQAVFFAPTRDAADAFVVATSLGLAKFLPYHVVVSDTELPVVVEEGSKLKTQDGQELYIVKVDGDLYVRDAKGNDARLRRPIEAKNGRIYIIDKVLLTQ